MHQGQAGAGAGRLTIARHRALILFTAAAAAYLLDRSTKAWAERMLPGDPIEVIPSVLDLRYTTNPGGAFGLFGSVPWLFAGVTLVVAVVAIATLRRVPPVPTALGLGLVVGGALGNLTDRLVRAPGLAGEVVDFIDLQVWPIFNLADSAIVVGAGILLVTSARADRAARRN